MVNDPAMISLTIASEIYRSERIEKEKGTNRWRIVR
jgi:hypothetical protein